MAYIWFLNILRLVLLSLDSYGLSENLQSATKISDECEEWSKQKLTSIVISLLIVFLYSTYTCTPYQYATGNVLVMVNQR